MPLPFRLLAIGDRGQATTSAVRDLAEAGGPAVALLLRDRRLSPPERVEWARELLPICRASGTLLLVHASPEAALRAGADGVHLPGGASVREARARLGPGLLVGASRHDGAGVREAAEAGASYATLSPVFESPGKGMPLGLEAFAAVARTAPLPVVALGGVRPERCAACFEAGAAAVAAIGAVWDGDPSGLLRASWPEVRRDGEGSAHPHRRTHP
jgi:thiamine-phosphate pyrophosphorylase